MASGTVSSEQQQRQLALYREPVSTPGLVPTHLKRATTDANPIIEIIQRLLFHLKPGSGANVEKVVALIALYRTVLPAWNFAKSFFIHCFTSQIIIPEYDPAAQEILLWVSSEVITKSMTTSATIMTGELGRHPSETQGYMRNIPGGQQALLQSKETNFLPPVGRRVFWVGFRPFIFARTGNGNSKKSAMTAYGPMMVNDWQGNASSAIVLYTPGWSLQPLKDLIKKCHEYKIANRAGTTTIYFSSGKADPYSGQSWSMVVKATRKLDTIDMDEETKMDLVNDAEYYYSDESKKFFADCGIPYRRGYLFYGPPGTGKTSFSAALAGHLRCDLYIINLATGDVSDGRLHRLFLELPRKCVVVIEDIDSCGIGREQGPAPTAPHPPTVPGAVPMMQHQGVWYSAPPQQAQKRNLVTLSGLLNAIDGNASAEGRLLIMTSNNPDVLDEALTRPGRVDKKIRFGRMQHRAIRDIFKRLVGRAAMNNFGYTAEQIEEYATEFSSKIPEDVFTPAQVQNFLQGCRGDPTKAMTEVDAWIENTRDQSPEVAKKDNIPLVPTGEVANVSEESEEFLTIQEGEALKALGGLRGLIAQLEQPLSQ